MNNSKRLVSWQWIGVIAIIILLGGMTFVAGFGTGFGTGRVTAPQYVASAASVLVRPDTPPAPAAASALPFLNQGGDVPQEFDLLWEAWDTLEKDYYGDLPDTPEMVGGLVTGMLRAAERETDTELDREATADEVISAVLGILEEDYGTLPAVDRLTYGAINGVMFRLDDDYTFLRDPEQARFFNEGLSGSFEGIGARVAEAEGGGVRIVEPFEGQPAWNAGIRHDDVILSVDGEDVTDLALSDAISLIRGPKGSDVVLGIKSPEQETRDVTVTRDTISIPVVEYELRDDGIAYLRLGEFSTPAVAQVRAALEEMLAQNPAGLVLDLRGNPGGLLRRRGGYLQRVRAGGTDPDRALQGWRGADLRRLRQGARAGHTAGGAGQRRQRQRVGDPGRRGAGHGPRRADGNDDLWQGVGAGPASTERRRDAERHHGALVHAQRPADPRRGTGA